MDKLSGDEVEWGAGSTLLLMNGHCYVLAITNLSLLMFALDGLQTTNLSGNLTITISGI